MNERIKQLAEQAGLSKAKYWMNNAGEIHFEKLMSLQDDHTEEVKKFAELIVRECARAVDKVYEDAEPDHGCYDWATWAEGSDVLKHFGVEE